MISETKFPFQQRTESDQFGSFPKGRKSIKKEFVQCQMFDVISNEEDYFISSYF